MGEMKNKFTTYGATLNVTGYTWEGRKCSYAYSIDPDKPPKTYKDCQRIAGDFESLTTAEVVITTTVSEQTTKKTVIVSGGK